MAQQTYSNHRRLTLGFHGILFLIIVLTFIGSLVNLFTHLGDHSALYGAALLVAVNVALLLIFYYMRSFPLKAQDRAIRAEEALRHYILTGKPIDPRLSIRQIVGLRFAADDEFAELAQRAVAENLGEGDIKKAIRNWRPDTYRV